MERAGEDVLSKADSRPSKADSRPSKADSIPSKADSFAAALALIASLPLTDAEKADAVRRLMRGDDAEARRLNVKDAVQRQRSLGSFPDIHRPATQGNSQK